MHVLTIAGYRIILSPNATCDGVHVLCKRLGLNTLIGISEFSDDAVRKLVARATGK